MSDALSVSQFIEVLNATLDSLGDVEVEGEVQDYKLIQNKWVVFQLMDEKANVGCFMPKWDLKIQIEDGMMVKVVGQPRLRDKGFFSFVLSSVKASGEGSLKRAFELLKKKLEQEGIFATERKRPLPRFPEHIALITSRDAAAYSDFIKVLKGRVGGLTISFIHTQVQGEDAPTLIISALEKANTELENLDAIVLIRGGGSLEDLMAFNDEVVVRAVAGSRTPIIVGIGHERDVTLAEMAADVRASTPSNSAELLVRSREEIVAQLSNSKISLSHQMQRALTDRQHNVEHAVSVMRARVAATISHVQNLVRTLQALSPTEILKRGYSITKTAAGKIVKDAKDVKSGSDIRTRFYKGRVTSTVR